MQWECSVATVLGFPVLTDTRSVLMFPPVWGIAQFLNTHNSSFEVSEVLAASCSLANGKMGGQTMPTSMVRCLLLSTESP